MSPGLTYLVIAVVVVVAVWVAFVLTLVLFGRRRQAADLARFIPDFLVLFQRLLGDARVPRAGKVAPGLTLVYLAIPFDLVPDFVPIAGQLDDAILVALVLRYVLRRSGPELVTQHWPGPPGSLALVLRFAGWESCPEADG